MRIDGLTSTLRDMAHAHGVADLPTLGLHSRHLTMKHALVRHAMERRAHVRDTDIMLGGATFTDWCLGHIDTILRREAWLRVFPRGTRSDVPHHDASHHMLLAHPLHALAVRTTPSYGINIEFDLARGMQPLMAGMPSVEVLSGDRVYVTMAGVTIPDTLLDNLAGRRIREVVELPHIGDGIIDPAVAACVIEEGFLAGPEPRHIVLLMAPTPWVPLTSAPDGVDPDWWRGHRYAA